MGNPNISEHETCSFEINGLKNNNKTLEQKKEIIASLTIKDLPDLQKELVQKNANKNIAELNKSIMNTFTKESINSLMKSKTNFTIYKTIISRNSDAAKAFSDYITSMKNKKFINNEDDLARKFPQNYVVALTQALTISCCDQGSILESAITQEAKQIDGAYGMNTLMAIKASLGASTPFDGVITKEVLDTLANQAEFVNRPASASTPTPAPTIQATPAPAQQQEQSNNMETFAGYTVIGADGQSVNAISQNGGLSFFLTIDNRQESCLIKKENNNTICTIGTNGILFTKLNLYTDSQKKEIRIAYNTVEIFNKLTTLRNATVTLNGKNETYDRAFDLSQKEFIGLHLTDNGKDMGTLKISNTGELEQNQIMRINDTDYTVGYDKDKKEISLTKKEAEQVVTSETEIRF